VIAIENMIRIDRTLTGKFQTDFDFFNQDGYHLPFRSKPGQLRKRIDIPHGPAPERERPLQF
jgi:hypothetical protein